MAAVLKKKGLHSIDNLSKGSNVTEPVISDQRKTDLTEKLELEKTALRLVAERSKRNELMLSYDYNPFRQMGVDRQPQTPKSGFKEKTAPSRIIIDQVQRLTDQPIREEYYTEAKKMVQDMGDLITLSQKINMNIDRAKFAFQKRQTAEVIQEKEQNPELNELTMKLSEIKKIEETNINLERPKNFDLLRETNQFKRNGTVGSQYLEEYFFVQNSVLETLGIVSKENLYREISKMSRLVIKGKTIKENILDYLDSYELSFNVRDLTFKDLMNIATGRFRQEFLFTYLNEIEMEKDDKLSLSLSGDDEEADYRPDQNNMAILTDDLDISEFEIECLINAPLEEEQISIKKSYNDLFRNIQEQINMKKKALERGINDKKVHENRRQKIIDSLKVFKLPNQMTERELKKLVGKNKLKKNKEQEIKLETFKRAVSSTIKGQKEEVELTSTIIYQQ